MSVTILQFALCDFIYFSKCDVYLSKKTNKRKHKRKVRKKLIKLHTKKEKK